MRKSILLLVLLTALAISGCLPQTQAPPATFQVTGAATASATFPVGTPASNSSPAATAAITTPTQAAVFPESSCTVVTKKPTAGPTAASIYPPVTAADWVKGPADAKVTILEYSDFQ